MIIRIVVFLLLITSSCKSLTCNGQVMEPLKGYWNFLEGNLGNNHISMSIYISDNGDIKGNYYNSDSCSTYRKLTGELTNKLLTLIEYDSDKISGYFNGNIKSDTSTFFWGIWSDSGERKKQFKVKVYDINGTNYPNIYGDMGISGSPTEIEQFVLSLKEAIKLNDKQWISNHINYPANIPIEGKYIEIKNKDELMKLFDRVFTEQYKNGVKNWCQYGGYWANMHGMRFNGGWLNNCYDSTTEKYDFCIVSLF